MSRLKHAIWNWNYWFSLQPLQPSWTQPLGIQTQGSSRLFIVRQRQGQALESSCKSFSWLFLKCVELWVQLCDRTSVCQLVWRCFSNVFQDQFPCIGSGSIAGSSPLSPTNLHPWTYQQVLPRFLVSRRVHIHAFHPTWRRSSAGMPTNCLRRTSRSACGWAGACSGCALRWVPRCRCCSYWVSC